MTPKLSPGAWGDRSSICANVESAVTPDVVTSARKERWRRTVLAAGLVVLAALMYLASLVQPSNQRDWEFGVDRLPQITMQAGSAAVHNVRDFRYTAEGTRSADYIDRVFAVDRIERVWFVQEPFTIAPFSDFKGVAHTYFVFDFQDQPPLAISVESRRERGEAY